MQSIKMFAAIVPAALLLTAAQSTAQTGGDVYWRIDPGVKNCSMDIDPSLTQDQWHTFTKQAAAISTVKSLAPATTLGAMKFRLAVDYTSTPVDQRDLAWINTFVHPDAGCPLGDAITIPTLRAAFGVSDNMELGGFWSTAPNANYGMVGAEYKWAFLAESEHLPAVAARASATILTGVPDFDLNIFGIDLLASKKIAMFTPYLGIRRTLAVGTETTPEVMLDREEVVFTQGFAGLEYQVWMLDLVAEYNVSSVNSLAFLVGFRF